MEESQFYYNTPKIKIAWELNGLFEKFVSFNCLVDEYYIKENNVLIQ